MNVFEAVKQSVTTRQAASFDGIRVGRKMCIRDRFNAVSYVATIILTLISSWIMVSVSIRKPIKIAAGISPIEACLLYTSTTPNMMNPRLYTTSYNKPQGQQFDDTAVLSFIKLQYT